MMDKKYYFAFVLSIVALLGNIAAYFTPWQYVSGDFNGGYWAVCKNAKDCQFIFNYMQARGKAFIAVLFILFKVIIFKFNIFCSVKIKIILFKKNISEFNS